MNNRLLIASEAGWGGARRLAIELAEKDIRVDILIKSRVSKEVLDIITPRKALKIKPIPRQFFRLRLFLEIIMRRHKVIVATKKKTTIQISKTGMKTVLLLENNNEFTLTLGRRKISVPELTVMIQR